MSRHLVSTTAAPSACPQCNAPILVALDEGLRARVDTTPIPNQAAEIAVLIQGRTTYTRLSVGWLVRRDASRIAGGSLRGPIHVEHRCAPRPYQMTIDQFGVAK